MATLNTLNKTISTTSQELTSTRNKDALLSNSRRGRNDINRISNFVNSVVVEGFKSLTSGETYPEDALFRGISGNTVVTHLVSCGNNKNAHEAFWLENTLESRPKTVKESIDYIISVLGQTNIINNYNQENDRINDAFDLINCNLSYIRKLSGEILGKNYEDLFSCSDIAKTYSFTLGTHLYNILFQLTEGMDAGEINPYLQEEDYDYPTLRIPFERISGRIEYLHQLLDVTIEAIEDGQIIRWDDGLGGWVNKDLPSTSVDNLSEIGDVSESAGSEGQVLRWRDGTGLWTPEDLPADLDTKVEYITELKDVDTSGGVVEGNTLVWDPSHDDESTNDGSLGAWIPGDVKATVSGENLNQRLGNIDFTNLNGVVSTLEDVESIGDDFENFLTNQNALNTLAEKLEAFYEFLKSSGKKYRPGSMLQFNGWDKWHSNLAGNISNLNAINFLPELYSKAGNFLSTITSAEEAMIGAGGSKMIPFVFANSYRVSYKEKLDPINVGRIKDLEYHAVGNLPVGFNNDLFEALIGGLHDASADKLNNEIEEAERVNSVGITSCNLIYKDSNGNAQLEYAPEYLLGVIRSDVSKILDDTNTSILKPFKTTTINNAVSLNGLIEEGFFTGVNTKALTGIGVEVQHSGYTKIMTLGPYEIGDNVYICPAHILKLFKINYPYGIVITDSFLNTPIIDFIESNTSLPARIALEENSSTIVSLMNLSMYDFLKEAVLNDTSSDVLIDEFKALFTAENYNKIISSPVGFITKEEIISNPGLYTESGSLLSLVRENVANTVCKNLLDSVIGSVNGSAFTTLQDSLSNIWSAVIAGLGNRLSVDNDLSDLFLFDSVIKKVFFNAAHRAYLCAGEISLPTIKIQLPGMKYNAVANNPYIFNPSAFNWSGLDWTNILNLSLSNGNLFFNSIDLGNVQGPAGTPGGAGSVGPEGPQGPAGPVGSSGSSGVSGISTLSISKGGNLFNTGLDAYKALDGTQGDLEIVSNVNFGLLALQGVNTYDLQVTGIFNGMDQNLKLNLKGDGSNISSQIDIIKDSSDLGSFIITVAGVSANAALSIVVTPAEYNYFPDYVLFDNYEFQFSALPNT